MRTLRGRRAARAGAASRGILLLGLLGLLGLLAGTAGCGPAADEAADTPATSTAAPSEPGAADPVTVAVLTGTVAGGTVDQTPTPLGTPEAVADFVSQFDNADFARSVEEAVTGAEVADGRTLVGSVLAIGCEVPIDIDVVGAPGSIRLLPVMAKKPRPDECFAPMTSVGLVELAEALLVDAG
jgi:hypothetical protein